ncbi:MULTISPECIES: NUDIX domain-containing protein [Corynebacterium]|uniref:NUDIX hydrolase n=1 Tax=Corynebacterium TaxID=1716 RepID=UPI001D2A8CD6|nr:NUDIX domain-containing protein [Corynebacterium phoceense]MCQ9336761.1 NUDIX domain-containing protein [Corynebacterium phoceense]HJG42959.1 NUDIX domain-containing protein [Corynebacterium phoceense]
MPTPDFVLRLRSKIGHEPLHLPGVTAVILRDVPMGAAVWEVPSVLLTRRADTGTWAPVAGISEPGEDIGETAVREVLEEVGLEARVEALLGSGKTDPVTYPNGDQCTFIDTALRLSVPDGAEPVVSDDENLDAAWFSVAKLPQSVHARHRMIIADAVAQMKHPQGFRPRVGFVKRSR